MLAIGEEATTLRDYVLVVLLGLGLPALVACIQFRLIHISVSAVAWSLGITAATISLCVMGRYLSEATRSPTAPSSPSRGDLRRRVSWRRLAYLVLGGVVGTYYDITLGGDWAFDQRLGILSILYGVLLNILLFYAVRNLLFLPRSASDTLL